MFSLTGQQLIGEIDGARVTYYSGVQPKAQSVVPEGHKK
jgi:hypothetical protein